MRFRTEISIPKAGFNISHCDKLLLMGSCFAEYIGNKLEASGFQADVNPFGVLYNPLSIASGLRDLMQRKVFTEEDTVECNGLFSSWSHHSRFSDLTPSACLKKIRERMEVSSVFLEQTSVLMVTFGTSYVYRLKKNGKLVSNCHKLPAGDFCRERLCMEEILAEWSALAADLRKKLPALNILMTVSPIRHWKDGAHANQLSKSILLLAIESLERQYDFIHYFPSYELILDDLRDYRFYADDMLHPSSAAIDYIWEKFSATHFDRATETAINDYHRIRQDLEHRPSHPESEAYKTFRANAEKRLKAFRDKTDSFK
ncbi:MAG: GSCFA domain-containing protein [Dysgonamonadaceae bacterium]|jgi:hypothetical protein|nr:GSCFA domain-containing protein [Dysgonamonadaceae bacterium]